jgi:polyhydroxyalkanoate synthase
LTSGGHNLLRGLENLLDDLERGGGDLRPSMSDETAFELGRDLAVTPGAVVFRNRLMEVIQYAPSTRHVHARPLLIVPPWINKYYILDLRPENSLIRWAVAQGYTVFTVSWVNPGPELAAVGFEDYLREGTLPAIECVRSICDGAPVNAVGYCLGGTLLAATLAWLAARGESPVASATLLTTLLDFGDPGELGVFLDDRQIQALERRMTRRGYLDGGEMALTFSLLRANDLIWSFYIHNYLLGHRAYAFDLLYWNADSTRMPAAMHSFYLRQMYLHNRLRQPDALSLAGERIDLGRIDVPTYFLSALDDHIAPWRSTYAGTGLPGGEVRFVLGESGHIAGVVNPPERGKYGFWVNEDVPTSPEAWLDGATRHPGSWWEDWNAWLRPRAGESVKARSPGSARWPPLGDAPGTYVRQRLT